MDRDTTMETRLVHAGSPEPRIGRAIATPIFQSATFLYGGESEYHDVRYSRLSNTPNHAELHARLADLEGAEAALVTASGMAAISTAILSVVGAGDHLLAQDTLYGGTHSLLAHDLARFGVAVDRVDTRDPSTWEARLRPETRAFYLETVSNPLLGVADVEAAVAFARAHGLVTLVDNTFPSPVNFRPAEWGVDLSLHSATKYLNGHSDVIAGAVIGSRERVDAARRLLAHLGGALDPHACFLLARGMKTLMVRMRFQERSALELARLLEAHPDVTRVLHPGLESHPDRARAARLLDGTGAMLSFELDGGAARARRFLAALRLFQTAPSLGGVESLATIPATTSHAGLSAEERAAAGISDGLVRLSVGIEGTADLVADVERALAG